MAGSLKITGQDGMFKRIVCGKKPVVKIPFLMHLLSTIFLYYESVSSLTGARAISMKTGLGMGSEELP
jgi:hypothetical protein